MVSGRVVRFDAARGYGFIAPEGGGEDVFLHVNDLLMPESYVRSGVAVEFEVEDGDRGLKASSVRLAHGADAAAPAGGSPGRGAFGHSGTRAAPVDGEEPMCDVLNSEEYTRETTELLLRTAPWLTGEHIVQIRHQLLVFAKGHGWVED